MTVVQKEFTNKIIVKHRTDLINHPYIMLLEIRKLDSRSKKPGRKMWVVNVHDNQVEKARTWGDSISCIQRALEDIR